MSNAIREQADDDCRTTLPVRSVELDWFAEADRVHVTPRNQQRFEISKDRAIEILLVAEEKRRRFEKQFTLLLEELATWICEHGDRIKIAFLTIQDGSFLFVVVRNEPRLDISFEDDLSSLDFRLGNDPSLDLVELHTLSLPPTEEEALRSFLFEPFTISYHGHRAGAHQTSQ